MTGDSSTSKRSGVTSKSQGPEHHARTLAVRSIVHRFGYRPRLHTRDLPGFPKLVLSFDELERVIFVHACVWYRHRGDADSLAKADLNAGRTKEVFASFRHLGGSAITVWGCHLRKPERVGSRLGRMLAARA